LIFRINNKDVKYIAFGGLSQDHQYLHSDADWLEDRKKLKKDWYNYLKASEEKLKTLLKDREWAINYPAVRDYLTLNEQSTPHPMQASTSTTLRKQSNSSLRQALARKTCCSDTATRL
jgi:hypothetical protein